MPATLALHAELWRKRSGWSSTQWSARVRREPVLRYDVGEDAGSLERSAGNTVVVPARFTRDRAVEPDALPLS